MYVALDITDIYEIDMIVEVDGSDEPEVNIWVLYMSEQ